MTRTGSTSRFIAMLAIAMTLVVQSMVGAYALGIAGTGPQLDAFGNPLCLGSSDHDGSGSSSPGHSKLPPCCTFACSMFWPGLAAAGDLARVTVAIRISDPVVFTHSKTIYIPAPDYRESSPRAPPVNA